MEAKVYYHEIIDYVQDNYHQTIKIDNKTSKSLSVIYTVKAFVVLSKKMTLDINIDAVTTTSVTISYGGSIGVGAIVTAALAVLKAKMPEFDAAIHHKEGNALIVELDKFEKLKSIFQFLELENLSFTADYIILSLRLK